MNRNRLWTWLCLNVLIGLLHPRILYHLNKLIPASSGGTVPQGGSGQIVFELSTVCATGRAQSGHDNISRPAFLDNGYLRSSDGLVAFKKAPNSQLVPEYLECQIEGLNYFDTMFRVSGANPPPHEEIMREHHRILAEGASGEKKYQVGFSSERSNDVAGKLRHAGGRVAFPARERCTVNAILRALTEIGFYPDGPWAIPAHGIPEEAWSTAHRVRRGFDIAHPDGKYIPLYLAKMGECLSAARRLSVDGDDPERASLLTALGTYFHLGIHAHAFVRINQSLLWSQVNYVLMFNRFRPVHHGQLDLVAAFLDTGNFVSYFTRYVRTQGTKTGV